MKDVLEDRNGFMLWDLEDIRIKNEWCMSQTAAEIATEGHGGLLCGWQREITCPSAHLLSFTAEPSQHATSLSPLSSHVGFYLRSDIYFTKLFGEYFPSRMGHLPRAIWSWQSCTPSILDLSSFKSFPCTPKSILYIEVKWVLKSSSLKAFQSYLPLNS